MHPPRLAPAVLLAVTLSLLVVFTMMASPPPSQAAEPSGGTVTPAGRPPPMTFRCIIGFVGRVIPNHGA